MFQKQKLKIKMQKGLMHFRKERKENMVDEPCDLILEMCARIKVQISFKKLMTQDCLCVSLKMVFHNWGFTTETVLLSAVYLQSPSQQTHAI